MTLLPRFIRHLICKRKGHIVNPQGMAAQDMRVTNGKKVWLIACERCGKWTESPSSLPK